jgi:hypothetical protein
LHSTSTTFPVTSKYLGSRTFEILKYSESKTFLLWSQKDITIVTLEILGSRSFQLWPWNIIVKDISIEYQGHVTLNIEVNDISWNIGSRGHFNCEYWSQGHYNCDHEILGSMISIVTLKCWGQQHFSCDLEILGFVWMDIYFSLH